MKLSQALQLKQALEKTWEINDILPGPFEHVTRTIILAIQSEVKGLQATAKSRASKGLKEGQQPSESDIQKEINALLDEFRDEEIPLKLPRIKAEWLPEKVMKGTSAALEPVMMPTKEPSTSFIEKMIKAKEKKEKKPKKLEKA